MITLISFGFKKGEPPPVRVIDARGWVNPPSFLRKHTGLEKVIQDVVLDTELSTFARECALQLVSAGSPVSLAVGCNDGKHRSVAFVERVAALIRDAGEQVRVAHRDLVTA